MFYVLTHERAKQLHPKEYGELKSKNSKTPFDKFKIGYELSEKVEAFSITDVLSGKAHSSINDSVEDKLQTFRKNARVSLTVKGRGIYRGVPLQEIPEMLIDQRRKSLEKEEVERNHFKSLTPEQQEQETVELLKQLAGPGFVAVAPDKKMSSMCKKAGVRIIGKQ